MATTKSQLDYFLELLADIPDLHAKAMFGEYGIYGSSPPDKGGQRGVMFALVCDNILFFKTFPETIHHFADAETKAYPGSKNTAPVNPEWLESERDMLIKIVKETIALTPPPKPKKKKL